MVGSISCPSLVMPSCQRVASREVTLLDVTPDGLVGEKVGIVSRRCRKSLEVWVP